MTRNTQAELPKLDMFTLQMRRFVWANLNALRVKIRGKKFAIHGSSKMEVSFLVKHTEFALLMAVLFTKHNHFP